MRARGKGSLPGRVEVSSRAMLATARPSCDYFFCFFYILFLSTRQETSWEERLQNYPFCVDDPFPRARMHRDRNMR